jgi:hypothetical protein
VPPGRIIPKARNAASHPTSHTQHGDTRLATAPDRPTQRVSQSPERGPALAKGSRSFLQLRARTNCVVRREAEPEAVTGEARKDVEMDVPDVLAGGLTVCEKKVDALAPQTGGSEALGCRLGDSKHLCPVLGIERGQVCRMCFWDDKHVPRLHWLDIHHRERASILVHDADLTITGRESTKQTFSRTATHHPIVCGDRTSTCASVLPPDIARRAYRAE